MDRIRRARYAVTSFACVLVALAAVALAVFCLRSGDAPDDASEPVDEELVAMTNYISREFAAEDRNGSPFQPCLLAVERKLRAMTNDNMRVVVARHLAKETLCVSYTSTNYFFRWQALAAACDLMGTTFDCMWIAGIDDMERCEFLFAALENFKKGAIVTLDERDVREDEADKWGRGIRWAQDNCRVVARYGLKDVPTSLRLIYQYSYHRFRPDVQAYFRKRFREVFGIDLIPSDEKRPMTLWGVDGTRWDGKGLEWR